MQNLSAPPRLTGIGLVPLLRLLDAPAELLDVLADVIVAQLFLLDVPDRGAPLVPPLLGPLGDELLDVGQDPFLDRSCFIHIVSPSYEISPRNDPPASRLVPSDLCLCIFPAPPALFPLPDDLFD